MTSERAAVAILIVDDEPVNVRLLEQLLERAGYVHTRGITDSRAALPAYLEMRPDIVLLDLQMPDLDGFGVMQQIEQVRDPNTYVPILVLTADVSPETKRRALASGAKDFLTKPFDVVEVMLRIDNLLETRRLHLDLRAYSDGLEHMVRRRTSELEDARQEILDRLALAVEFRDDETLAHTLRVGGVAAAIAVELGWSDDDVADLRRAAPLHDVGKVGISDMILLKPGKLTDEEFEVIKTHTHIGERILSGSGTPILQLAELIARTHHERWDGNGYNDHLVGAEIPIAGRITAVADVFDALVHERPYKTSWPFELAVDEMRAQRGRQFDPEVLDAFLVTLERGLVPVARPASVRGLTGR